MKRETGRWRLANILVGNISFDWYPWLWLLTIDRCSSYDIRSLLNLKCRICSLELFIGKVKRLRQESCLFAHFACVDGQHAESESKYNNVNPLYRSSRLLFRWWSWCGWRRRYIAFVTYFIAGSTCYMSALINIGYRRRWLSGAALLLLGTLFVVAADAALSV